MPEICLFELTRSNSFKPVESVFSNLFSSAERMFSMNFLFLSVLNNPHTCR